MPELNLNPDPNLSDRLDALGRSLASGESSEPSTVLIAAMRARRRRAVFARIGSAAALAAALALATITYISLRPASVAHDQPIAVITDTQRSDRAHQSPTLATLRNLNRDASPESLRFPTITSLAPATAQVPTRAGDARNPDSVARLIGASR